MFFVSYELMRADFVSRLSGIVPPDQLQPILDALDQSADRFDVSPKCTDLIVCQDFMEPVRLYIASKSVENLATRTLKNYYYVLSRFINAMQRPIDQITAVNVRVYLDNYRRARNVKDGTLEGVRIVIKDFFSWCVEEGLLQKNPCSHVKAIRCPDNTRQPLSAIDLEKIRKAASSPREVALVEVLYSTMARISEISNMKISDIDFSERTVVIPHGKGDKRRVSYLNAKSVLAIHAYLATREDHCEYLFVNDFGVNKHKVSAKSLQTIVRKVADRTDVAAHVTPHVFRTTSSTHALDSGMPIEQVQRILGHAKIQTTLRYAKINDAEVKRSHQKYVS